MTSLLQKLTETRLDTGGLSWRELFTRIKRQAREQDLMGQAAQVAFFFVLAFFPLLLFLSLLLSYVTQERGRLRDVLIEYLSAVTPVSASQMIETTIQEISESNGRGGKLSLGLIVSLWIASNGMRAVCKALNAAYGVERRGWWHERLLGIILTVALGIFIVAALTLLLYGSDIAAQLALDFGLSSAFTLIWRLLQYPLILLFVVTAFGMLYYFAPNIKQREARTIVFGTLVGVVLWLGLSFGLKQYLRHFSTIKTTYGSFGAVMTLMIWSYLSSIVILTGGTLNAIIAKAKQDKG